VSVTELLWNTYFCCDYCRSGIRDDCAVLAAVESIKCLPHGDTKVRKRGEEGRERGREGDKWEAQKQSHFTGPVRDLRTVCSEQQTERFQRTFYTESIFCRYKSNKLSDSKEAFTPNPYSVDTEATNWAIPKKLLHRIHILQTQEQQTERFQRNFHTESIFCRHRSNKLSDSKETFTPNPYSVDTGATNWAISKKLLHRIHIL
jgi:hypothetical protein